MGKSYTSERHKPSFISYLMQNLKTTFAITERSELMTAFGLISLSAFLALVGGLVAPRISETLTAWQLRVAFGLILFVVIQFGIITPFRMWRKSTWVANIEKMLEELWDYHDKGVELLNSHYKFQDENPDAVRKSDKANEWVNNWVQEVKEWTDETQEKLFRFYPIEARGFKNIVIYENRLVDDSLNHQHHRNRNMLLRRLEMLKNVLERHQPALLPE